jgi:hypothetical protein
MVPIENRPFIWLIAVDLAGIYQVTTQNAKKG